MDASASEIDSADISCDESFETECSIAGGSSCDNEDISCGYLGEPEYTEPINQLNLPYFPGDKPRVICCFFLFSC